MADSIISSVVADLRKARRESAKAITTKLYKELITAYEVVAGLEQKIEEELTAAGDTPEEIQKFLRELAK